MKFTKEEINLCKRIAETWRKPLKQGDFILTDKVTWGDENIELVAWVTYGEKAENAVIVNVLTQSFVSNPIEKLIPLWQIHNALAWLREKGYKQGDLHFNENLKAKKKASVYIEVADKKGMFVKDMFRKGKTLLEALLKAVLEVLRKEGEK